MYATPTVAGSRSGSNIAGCWATLLSLGKEGYLDATKRIRDTTQYLVNQLRIINGIFIYGQPEVNLFAIGSEKFNILSLGDLLGKKGWNFNLLQYPYAQRIDLLPESFKQQVKEKFEKHIEWLRPQDHLTRATKGFESGLDYMMRRDNSKDMQQFKDTMKKMDVIRDEDILQTFPELAELYEKN